MMRHTMKCSIAVVFVSAFYLPEASPSDSTSNTFSTIVGIKDLDLQDWPPYGEQYSLGFEFVFRKREFPLALVLEYFSADAEFNYFGSEQSSSQEFSAGLRHEVSATDKIRPYLEGGVTYAKGEVNLEGSNIDPDRIFNESAKGAWLAAGNTWLGENDLNYGFKIKKTVAKTDLSSGRTIDLGGIHYMFTIGFDF